ncbi:LCP family protein [Microlunatus speluncae]|uniref:LCP family protein n=1 Tax=Microlunatus speluncae TaxID=2594267 RepID=UPI00126654F9|nr:LCP family protein [Microlunatus speluncae]
MPDTPVDMFTFTEDEPPQQRPQPAKKKRGRALPAVLIAVAGVLVLSLVAGFLYAASLNKTVSDNIQRRDDTMPEESDNGRPDKQPSQEKGAVNFVLLGSDSRDPSDSGNGRSDVLIVAHLNAERNKAYLISFTRDLWVTIPGKGKAKINAAYSWGGPKLTIKTVESITGARIDHLALIDFEGFIQLTSDLGGVTVTNDQEFSTHGFTYPKGEITISGEEALWFVRERKKLKNGDLDRAKNHRKVIQAILEKGLSPETIANPQKFTSFVGGVASHLTVDSALTDDKIRDLAFSLRLPPSQIYSLQAPIARFGTSDDGQAIDIVDEEKMAELSKALREDKLDEYVAKYPPKE